MKAFFGDIAVTLITLSLIAALVSCERRSPTGPEELRRAVEDPPSSASVQSGLAGHNVYIPEGRYSGWYPSEIVDDPADWEHMLEVWAGFEARYGTEWHVAWQDVLHTPRNVYFGTTELVPGNTSPLSQEALQALLWDFIEREREFLRVDPADLVFYSARYNKGNYNFRFKQLYNGLFIRNFGDVTFYVRENGQIRSLGSTCVPRRRMPPRAHLPDPIVRKMLVGRTYDAWCWGQIFYTVSSEDEVRPGDVWVYLKAEGPLAFSVRLCRQASVGPENSWTWGVMLDAITGEELNSWLEIWCSPPPESAFIADTPGLQE